MRWLINSGLLIGIVVLQYRLWFDDGSWSHIAALERDIQQQQQVIGEQSQRNSEMAERVRLFKQGYEGVEARARRQLGMIKRDETFYLVVNP